MQKNKRTITILLLILCIFILSGWGKKTVELLNDTPLIDLKKAIKEAPIGNQGNSLISEEKELESEEINTDSQTESISKKDPAIVQEETEDSCMIIIRNKSIKYNNSVCKDLDTLKNRIESDFNNGLGKINLVDDYAEANTYNDVREYLQDLHETIGLEFVDETKE